MPVALLSMPVSEPLWLYTKAHTRSQWLHILCEDAYLERRFLGLHAFLKIQQFKHFFSEVSIFFGTLMQKVLVKCPMLPYRRCYYLSSAKCILFVLMLHY